MIGLRAVLVAVGAAAIVAAYHNLPVIGPGARIDRIEAARDEALASRDSWRRYGKAEKAAFDASERYRAAERLQAVAAQDETQKACAARVARARASGAAIAAIVNKEPRRDQAGCPVRALADPDILRDALTPRSLR